MVGYNRSRYATSSNTKRPQSGQISALRSTVTEIQFSTTQIRTALNPTKSARQLAQLLLILTNHVKQGPNYATNREGTNGLLSIIEGKRAGKRRAADLDLGLDIVDGVAALDLERDGLPRQRLHEDLHLAGRGSGSRARFYGGCAPSPQVARVIGR